MLRRTLAAVLAAVLCVGGGSLAARAAEVESGAVYCFGSADFGPEQELLGICLTELPDCGSTMLGSRILRPGDILTAGQLAQMTFAPVRTEQDAAAQVSYLPIYDRRVEPEAVMTIAIRGREDKPPVAEDMALETYKNLPNSAKLKAKDPEGEPMTFTVTRQPRRGTVTIAEDGSFTYTPKKNKVGVDSFTYTAADPAGKVSREATVTVTILKPQDAAQYQDTLGRECRFAAEWMKNTGIFVGETLAGEACFSPEKQVTRGEFVTMLVKALEVPEEEDLALAGYTDDVPKWLQPYLMAAMRSGFTAGLPEQQTFGAEVPITGAEAAVLLQNALDLTAEALADAQSAVPVWAQNAMLAMQTEGIDLEAEEILTRADAARVLYQAVKILEESAMDFGTAE